MPGFVITNYKQIAINDIFTQENQTSMIVDSMVINNYFIGRQTLDKFLNDKLFNEISNYLIITEGIFLNKEKLCKQYDSGWCETCATMISEKDEFYFDSFRGVFSGCHYDKFSDKWVFYTSTTGEKPLYYYENNGKFIVCSDLMWISNILKRNNISYNVDVDAVYNMLTYGFMASNRTYIQNVKKLEYGEYLVWENGCFKHERYYELPYQKCNNNRHILSDDEIIEEIDRLFSEAIELEYKKDLEYGYKHIACLSGGLDSRMNVWVAVKKGYTDMLNLNFCQSGYLDETIAENIANQLGTELLIKTLDDGKFLTKFKDITLMNSGMTLYSGVSHLFSALKDINLSQYGILHTGDIGDVVIGVFDHTTAVTDLPGAYSVKLSKKVSDRLVEEDIEKYLMRTRAYNGVLGSKAMSNHYVDCVSPFLYRDFLDYCIGRIPYEKRKDHSIYKKWIIDKYPDAAEIPVERYFGGLLTEGKTKQFLRKVKYLGVATCFDWLLWKLHLKNDLNHKIEKNSMNPFDKWYFAREDIRKNMDGYFVESLNRIHEANLVQDEVCQDIEWLYWNGTTIEKTQCITVVCAVELLF